ncbi:MAG TPA: hypothetical protein PKX92_14050 [Edaphocola sp.]|nr:hypothetical protein [Edaphocola sp.]
MHSCLPAGCSQLFLNDLQSDPKNIDTTAIEMNNKVEDSIKPNK